MNRIRRCLLGSPLILIAGRVGAQAIPASAAGYPDRPIRYVIPFQAGSSIDAAGRLIAQKLAESLGQPVVVENRAGAGGNVGADAVAKSPPDGYTLLHTVNSLAAQSALYPNLPFDPVRDLTPIVAITSYPFVLVVNPALPAQSLNDLIALAKKQPGKVTFGSAGVGAPDHLAGELLAASAGIKFLHVPFKGGSAVLTEIIGGRIDATFTGITGGLPHIKSGKLRAIAVSTSTRSRQLPDVPAVAESGFVNFDIPSSSQIYAPAQTPRDIIVKLNAAVLKILAMPDVRARFDAFAVEQDRIGGDPVKLAEQLKAEAAQWKKLIEQAGIRPGS